MYLLRSALSCAAKVPPKTMCFYNINMVGCGARDPLRPIRENDENEKDEKEKENEDDKGNTAPSQEHTRAEMK